MAGNTPFSLSLKHVSLMSARLVMLPPWVPFKVLLHCSMLLETSCWLSWIWDNLLRACRTDTHTSFTVQSACVPAQKQEMEIKDNRRNLASTFVCLCGACWPVKQLNSMLRASQLGRTSVQGRVFSLWRGFLKNVWITWVSLGFSLGSTFKKL